MQNIYFTPQVVQIQCEINNNNSILWVRLFCWAFLSGRSSSLSPNLYKCNAHEANKETRGRPSSQEAMLTGKQDWQNKKHLYLTGENESDTSTIKS